MQHLKLTRIPSPTRTALRRRALALRRIQIVSRFAVDDVLRSIRAAASARYQSCRGWQFLSGYRPRTLRLPRATLMAAARAANGVISTHPELDSRAPRPAFSRSLHVPRRLPRTCVW